MTLSYKYSGVKEDGSSEVLAEMFDSKGTAFVSAMKSATQLRCRSNPKKFIRLEIQDDEGHVIDEYMDHDWLKCGTERK
jgi:hypothetical protein